MVEERLKAAYGQVCPQYRRDDELEVRTENHRRLAGIIQAICGSFEGRISVLDAGCGTGRYFHCVKNAARLVGIDLSPEMLKAAETPVRQELVSAEMIKLMCANIHLVSMPTQSFDFIYSLGMFGNGCPVTVELCNKFHEWLTAGGKLFFNAVESSSVPLLTRARTGIRRLVYPLLPRHWQKRLDERQGRLPFFALTKGKLEKILCASRFGKFTIARHVCQSPLWKGVHLECTAFKA